MVCGERLVDGLFGSRAGLRRVACHGVSAGDAQFAQRLTEWRGQLVGACRFAGRLTDCPHLGLAQSDARTDAVEQVGLAVGDIGQHAAEEIEAVVAVALLRFSARALHQRFHDAAVGHAMIAQLFRRGL